MANPFIQAFSTPSNNNNGSNGGVNNSRSSSSSNPFIKAYQSAPTPIAKPQIQQAVQSQKPQGIDWNGITKNIVTGAGMVADAATKTAGNLLFGNNTAPQKTNTFSNGQKYTFTDPTANQSAGMKFQMSKQEVQQPAITPKTSDTKAPGGTTLSVAKPVSVWDNITNYFKGLSSGIDNSKDATARAQNAYALSHNKTAQQQLGLNPKDANNGTVLKALADPGGNIAKNSLPETLFKQLGVSNIPTHSEFTNMLMAAPVGLGFAEVPVATLKAIGLFSAVNQVKSGFINALNGKGFDVTKSATVSDLTPNASPEVKNVLDVLDFLGTGAATHGMFQASPKIGQILTKDVLVKHDLPQTLQFTPSQVASVAKGTETGQLKDDLAKIGLTSTQWRDAVKNGVSVQLPTEKVVTLVDKPYWKNIKQLFDIAPSDAQVHVIKVPSEIKSSFGGYLPETVHEPQAVIDHVFTHGQQDTPQGKEFLKAALDAKSQGQHIQVGDVKTSENNRPVVNDTTVGEGANPPVAEANKQTSRSLEEGRGGVTDSNANTDITSFLKKPETPLEKTNNEYLTKNLEQAKQDYTKRIVDNYGSDNIISADEAKYVLPGFEAKHSATYHEAASSFAKYIYQGMLAANKGKGNNTVLFTAGGTGSGKTSGLRNAGVHTGKYAIAYDTNLSGEGSAAKKIQAALDNGYKVDVAYVQRDPVEAFENGVIPRARKEGRLITIDDHIHHHSSSFATLEGLIKKFGDKIDVTYVDNTRGRGNATISPFDKLPKFDYNKDVLRSTLNEKVNDAILKNKSDSTKGLTEEEATAIRKGIPQTELVRRQPQQEQQITDPRQEESINAVRDSLYYGDPDGAKALYDVFSKDNITMPSFNELQKEIEQHRVDNVVQLEAIKKELLQLKENGNPDDPTNQLLKIARELQDHFSRPKAKFKITGTERTYKSADGKTMLVGGNATQAFDRLIHATDIEGFSQHIKILAEKFDNNFTVIYDRIKSGAIDGGDYEQFKQYFDSIQGQRISAGKAGNKSSQSAASRQSLQDGAEFNATEVSKSGKENDRADENAGSTERKNDTQATSDRSGNESESTRALDKPTDNNNATTRTEGDRNSVDDIGAPAGGVQVERGSIQLNAGIDPGMKQFFESEIQPAYEAVREVGREWNDVINPPKSSEKAARASNYIRKAKSEIANYNAIMLTQLKQFTVFYRRYSDEQNINNISNYEKTGQWSVEPKFTKPFTVSLPNSNEKITFTSFNEFYRAANLAAYKVLAAAYGKTPETYIENYVRRAFVFGSRADEAKGTAALTNFMRSLSGSKSPLKHRVLDMPLKEALADMRERKISVKMSSANPIELLQWNLTNAQRAISYKQAWDDAKASKLVTFVRKGAQIPEGFVRLQDRAAEVFAPAELHFPTGTNENNELTFQKDGFQSAVPMGSYYADPGVARVFNNAISSGLEGSPTFRGIRFISNMMNQFQLAFSGFHFTAVGIDAGVTDISIGLRYAISGKPIDSAKHLGTGVVPFVSFFKDLYHGRALINDLKENSPEAYAFIKKTLNPAGGRLGQDAHYENKTWEKIQHAFLNNNPIGATVRAILYLPPFLTEIAGHPLIGYAVPRVKLGAFMDLSALKLSQLPKDHTDFQRQQALVSAWTSIDNRMGQLVYDNLFWNKVGKDVAMLSTRSVGWNLGTIRELGGATVDIAGTVRGKGISDRMLWGAGLVMYIALLSAIYQYLHTGTAPQELKDYFHPKNGLTDKNGNDDRVNFPSYMKDIFAYSKDPLGTMVNKTSPLISMTAALISNRDYYGNLVRNPNDPAGTQLSQVGSYILQNVWPFSIQQFNNQLKLGANPEQLAESFFGIIKAPQSVIRSDAQNDLLKAYQDKVGLPSPKTPEEVKTAALKSQARDEIQAQGGNWRNSPAFKELMQNGTLQTQKQRLDFLKSTKLTPQERMIKALPKDQRAQFGTAADRMSLADSTAMKQSLLRDTSVSDKNPTHYQLDHIIPLELGGTNDPENIRLMPKNEFAPGGFGASTKDKVENQTAKLVREGHMSLPDAQKQMANDWVGLGKREGVIKSAQEQFQNIFNTQATGSNSQPSTANPINKHYTPKQMNAINSQPLQTEFRTLKQFEPDTKGVQAKKHTYKVKTTPIPGFHTVTPQQAREFGKRGIT